MSHQNYYEKARIHFFHHYADRFRRASTSISKMEDGGTLLTISSPSLKEGNEPRMYLHAKRTTDVVVLSHGLSDSPYYMSAAGKRFYEAGANVILTLLPGHGLKDPDKAMEDGQLDSKWRDEIDNATIAASFLAKRISLGGFSTGGALSFNKILRDPSHITGGLFLFSAAIDVKLIESLSRYKLVAALVQHTDGKILGYGKDPYKYPKLPKFPALELGQIIEQNQELSKDTRITQPVFAAHSINDDTAKLEGILHLLKEHAEIGTLYTIAQNVNHAELPLAEDIPIDPNYSEGKSPKANPQFTMMMDACIGFYKTFVLKE